MKPIFKSTFLLIITNAVSVLFMLYTLRIIPSSSNMFWYIIIGTLLNIILISLILMKNKIGYYGIILWYGIQIFDTDLIMNNFRYGFILKMDYNIDLGFTKFHVGINYTAILILIIAIYGMIKFKKSISENY